MGRRPATARFMPGVYVFPGGRAAPADRLRWCVEMQSDGGMRASAHALARAAIRETYEETGLLLARPGRHAEEHPVRLAPLEEACLTRGLCPAIDALTYVGRAITPRQSPIRFNTRFFVADGRLAQGVLVGNGELDDLAWRAIDDCLSALPIADVTRFMLERALKIHAGSESGNVTYYYVGGTPRVRVAAPALA